MRVVGVEPTRLAAQEPKSCASANSTIPAYSSILQLRPNRLNIVSVPAEKVNHCTDISALHSAYYRRTIVSFSMAERGFCRCADQNYAALAALRQLIFWWPRWRCWAGCGTVCLLKFCWNPARPLPCPVLPMCSRCAPLAPATRPARRLRAAIRPLCPLAGGCPSRLCALWWKHVRW
jgi:hypothetical protein